MNSWKFQNLYQQQKQLAIKGSQKLKYLVTAHAKQQSKNEKGEWYASSVGLVRAEWQDEQ